jgi:hypothetical protein
VEPFLRDWRICFTGISLWFTALGDLADAAGSYYRHAWFAARVETVRDRAFFLRSARMRYQPAPSMNRLHQISIDRSESSV